MTATKRKELTPTQAAELWDRLRGHFVKAEEVIAEIIETRAWEPLGFSSFGEAWETKLQGIEIASTAGRARVVYQLDEEGLSPEEIALTLGSGSRVGAKIAENFTREKVNGVPPELATGRGSYVSAHVRRPRGASRVVHAEFSTVEYKNFQRIAKLCDRSIGDIAAEAIREKFESLS